MKRLIVDYSSVAWAALRGGVDDLDGVAYEWEEETKTKGIVKRVEVVNSAAYGAENLVQAFVSLWKSSGVAPKDTIFVLEEGSSTDYRKALHEEYKKKPSRVKIDQWYTEFEAMKATIKEWMSQVGAQFITVQNVEADDTIAYLINELEGKKIIVSNDKDLAVLMGPDVAMNRIAGYTEDNPCGDFDPKLITLYKALVGDSSDNYPGVKGFGEVAWTKLLHIIGEEGLHQLAKEVDKACFVTERVTGNGFVELVSKSHIKPGQNFLKEEVLIDSEGNETRIGVISDDDIAEIPVLGKIVEQQESVRLCYKLAKLYPEILKHDSTVIKWDNNYVHPASEITHELLAPFGMTTMVGTGETLKECLRLAQRAS